MSTPSLNPESPEARANVALRRESDQIVAAHHRGEISLEEMRAALLRCTPVVSAPEALPIRAALLAVVDQLLREEVSFAEFERNYLRLYHDELPDWGLAWADEEPLSEISERLQWSASGELSLEERHAGWQTRPEFLAWLREYRREVAE